jgi:hypothetical protein
MDWVSIKNLLSHLTHLEERRITSMMIHLKMKVFSISKTYKMSKINIVYLNLEAVTAKTMLMRRMTSLMKMSLTLGSRLNTMARILNLHSRLMK